MQKLWIVPSFDGAGALKSLIINLNELVEANIDTRDAIFIEAPDEYADLIQRVATHAGMQVSKESEIEATEITGTLPWKATLNAPCQENTIPLMLPETHPGYTGVPGKVNVEALLDGWEPEAEKAGADSTLRSDHICQNCGEAFTPKRKGVKFCDREACDKDRKRKYAKKYYHQSNGKAPATEPAAEPTQEPKPETDDFYADAPLASSLDADRIKLFPYEIMDGGDKGRRLDGTTLGVWLSIGRLPIGTLVKHDKRGLHIVDRDGKRKTAILRKTYQKHIESEAVHGS